MFKALLKESAVYGSVKVLTPILGFLTIPFFTRIFNQEQYGLLSIYITIISISTILFTLSLESSYTRFFNETKFLQKNILNIVLKFYTIYGSILLLLLFFLIYLASRIFNFINDYNVLYLIVIVSFTVGLINFFIAHFRMNHMTSKFSIVSLINIIFSSGLSVLLVYYNSNIMSYFTAIIISNILAIFFCIKLTKLDLKKTLRVSVRQVLPLLKFSIPLIPASMAMFFNNAYDRWCIAYYLNTVDVAVYTVGAKISSLAMLGVTIVMFVFMPHSMKIIQLKTTKANYILERYLRYFTFLFFSGLILLQLLSPFFINLIVPDDYNQSFKVVGFLSASAIFYGLTYFSCLGSWKAKYSRDYSISICFGISLNCVINLYLTPRYGIIGASISTMIGMLLTVITSFYFSFKRHPYNFSYLRLILVISVNILWLSLYLYFIKEYNYIGIKIYTLSILVFLLNFLICFKFFEYKLFIEKIKIRFLRNGI